MSAELTLLDFTEYVVKQARDFSGRAWLLQALNAWLTDPAGSQTFLILGEPGSGKSAFAAQLVQYASGSIAEPEGCPALVKGFLHAIHFCQANDPLTVDPTMFAQSLGLQLADRFPEIRDTVLAHSHGPVFNITQQANAMASNATMTAVQIGTLRVGDLDARVAFNRLVDQPLRALLRADSQRSVVLLVDGIDEAPVYSQGIGIAQLLANLDALPRGVRFILTSSPVRAATDLSKQSQTRTCSLTSGEGLKHSLDDIQHYAMREIGARPGISQRMAKTVSAADIAAVMRDKSEGNFLYVKCILDMLATQAEPITRESLAAFPVGLDRFYGQYLRRLVAGDMRIWEERLAPVLGTLAVSYEPLTEVQVANYTAQGAEQVRQTLSDLPYLDVDTSLPFSQRVYALFHQSFARFLLDGDRSEEFWCNPLTHHQNIIDFYRADGWERVDWDACDEYGLIYLVYHVRSALPLIRRRPEQEQLARSLYTIVLSPAYAHAQHTHIQNKSPLRAEADPADRQQEIFGLAAQGVLNFLGLGDSGTKTTVGSVVVRHKTRVRFSRTGVAAAAATVVGVSDPPSLDFTRLHLRAAIEIALERRDWQHTLALVRAYHMSGRLPASVDAVFQDIDDGNIGQGLQRMTSARRPTETATRWMQALALFLAWEAAQQGKSEQAQRIIKIARSLAPVVNNPFSSALAMRVAVALTKTSTTGRDARSWVNEWAWEGATELLDRYEHLEASETASSSEPQPEPNEALVTIEQAYHTFVTQREQRFLNLSLEEHAKIWQDLQPLLLRDFRGTSAQETLTRLIQLVLAEPIAGYREVMLLAIAQICVFIPEPAQFRRQMRAILKGILDLTAPSFAFELPAVLLAEMRRRGMPAPELADHLDRATAREDGWGTSFRAHLARASASLLNGQEAEALQLLEEIHNVAPGCARYAYVHLLALASRWQALRQSERVVPGSIDERCQALHDAAFIRANRIVEREARRAGVSLVVAHQAWQAEDTPSLGDVQSTFPDLAVPLATSAYLDHVASRWALPSSPLFEDGLKALVLLGLQVDDPVDAPLARLIAARVPQMSDAELTEVVRECVAGLAPLPVSHSPLQFPVIEDCPTIARQLLDLGGVQEQRGDLPQARNSYQKSREAYARLQQKEMEGMVLTRLAAMAGKQGAYDEARLLYEESWRIGGESVTAAKRSADLFDLGEAARERRDFEVAEAVFQEALTSADGTDERFTALCQNRLGLSIHAEQRHTEARVRYTQSFSTFQALGDNVNAAVSLLNVAAIAEEEGAYDSATQLAVVCLGTLQNRPGQEALVGENLTLLAWLLARQQRDTEARQVKRQADLYLNRRSRSDQSNTFELLSGERVPVEMMPVTTNSRYVSGDGYQAVEIPMQGSQVVVLIVPDRGKFHEISKRSLVELVASIDATKSETAITLAIPE